MTIKFIDENGITKTPNDFSLAVLPNHEHEAIPETIDRTLSIPERDGLLYYGSNLGARYFNIPMIVKPQDDRIEMQKRIREFSNFILNQHGKPRMIKIAFDYEPDKYYHVRFSGRVSPERYYRMAEFDLPLIADDPYAYSEMDEYNQDGLYYDVGLTYNDHSTSLISWESVFDNALIYPNPLEFDWILNKHYSSVYNHSLTNTSLNLTIEGEVINPKITNTTTGESMLVNIHLKQGETIEIRGDKFTAEYQGENIFHKVYGNFVELVSGDNKLIFQGGKPNAKITYQWKHKYV
jgi:predicted phage tail component-like protein